MITICEIWLRATEYNFGIKKNLGILIESNDPKRDRRLYRISNGALVEAYTRFTCSSSEFGDEEALEEMKYFGKVIILDGDVEIRTFPSFKSFWAEISSIKL